MRKKFIKIISVLVACITVFCLFVIPASAEQTQTLFNDFWTLDTESSEVSIRQTIDGDYRDITNSVWYGVLSDGKILGVNFTANEDWGAGNVLRFNFHFLLNSQYTNPGVSNLRVDLCEWNSHTEFLEGDTQSGGTANYDPQGFRYSDFVGSSFEKQESEYSVFSHRKGCSYIFSNFNSQYGFKRVVLVIYLKLVDTLSAGDYKVYFEFSSLKYQYSTEGEYLNQQIINNQNENTDKIISNQNENTDKILNGDEDLDSSGETDKVDGALGDVDDATNNALGGKSDEDVQAEVSGAIDAEKLDSIDLTKAKRMSTFYDRCLVVFGKDYNSLLLLSLILGLSAFLIGRRYG